MTAPTIAVLVPCYNEEAAIADVIRGFRQALPAAHIYVYDNNSTDDTVRVATEAGAIVRRQPMQGKGHQVRRMFSDVEADIYVMVDGDATYEAAAAPRLIERLKRDNLDMVNGVRVTDIEAAYRPGHKFGNWLLTELVRRIFGARFTDMLSGYRVFSRRFVKTFPVHARGFEIETELTVHALQMRLPVGEENTVYKDRPVGSTSKLRTFHDGFKILFLILQLVKEELPLKFFGLMSLVFFVASLGFGVPVIAEFISTGLVPRLPTAVLAATLGLLGCVLLAIGLILESVTRGRLEVKHLAYLNYKAPDA